MLLPAGITILVMSAGKRCHWLSLQVGIRLLEVAGSVEQGEGVLIFFFLAKFITDTQLKTQGKTELCFDF